MPLFSVSAVRISLEYIAANFEQRGEKELSQPHTGDQLADPYCQHEEGNTARYVICVGQDKGNDEHIGYDRRNRTQEPVPAKRERAGGPDQRREGSKDNIRESTSGDQVADQAADGQSGNRSRSKKRKDCERLGEADLDRSACEVKTCSNHCKYGVNGRDHRRLDNVTGLVHNAVRGELRTGILRTFRISVIICSCVHSHGFITPFYFFEDDFAGYNNCRHEGGFKRGPTAVVNSLQTKYHNTNVGSCR